MVEGAVAVIFSSTRSGEDESGYREAAERMVSLAAEQPGYLGMDSVRDVEGQGITVSYWADEASALAWKEVTEHRAIQALGRERWYRRYDVHVARIARSYIFRADA